MMDLGYTVIDNGNVTLVIEILAILALTSFTAKVVGSFLSRSFHTISHEVKIDKTQFLVLSRITVLLIYIIGFIIAASLIPGLASVGLSILASAGILAIVLGFAAQQTLSNIISGIFIAIFRPFSVGDKVSIGEDYGTIEDITLRHTVIKTWQEKRIVIPNSRISEEAITNYTINDPRMLGTLEIGISYDSNIDKARKIMKDEALKHPDLLKKKGVRENDFLDSEGPVRVRLIELSDFAQKLRLYYWAPDQSTSIKMKFDLLESIKKRFDKEGIEIPFPYRTIVYKKDILKESTPAKNK